MKSTKCWHCNAWFEDYRRDWSKDAIHICSDVTCSHESEYLEKQSICMHTKFASRLEYNTIVPSWHDVYLYANTWRTRVLVMLWSQAWYVRVHWQYLSSSYIPRSYRAPLQCGTICMHNVNQRKAIFARILEEAPLWLWYLFPVARRFKVPQQ